MAGAPSVGEDLDLAVRPRPLRLGSPPSCCAIQGRGIRDIWPKRWQQGSGGGVLVFAVRLGHDAFRVRALLASATDDVPAELEGGGKQPGLSLA